MIDEKLFRTVCENKIPIALKYSGCRNIWIYGAGCGGTILYELLTDHGVVVSGFIDKRYDEIKMYNNLPVVCITELNPSVDYIFISMRSYEGDVVDECYRQGYSDNDMYVISAGDDVNKEDIVYMGCKVGRYTYGYEGLLSNFPIAESIGRFCSIAGSARIFNNHPMEFITTHPFIDNPRFFNWENKYAYDNNIKKFGKYKNNAQYENSEIRRNEPVHIGNDVWIGANVIILPGVHIGDGAVIAAGAVVTSDVGDYEVVGGVPAKTLSIRFSEENIDVLKSIRWWDWSDKEIQDNIEFFYQPDIFIKRFKNYNLD